MLPKIKKKLTSFLTEEEGKISKQSLLSLGSFLSAAVIGGILATKNAAAATHSNSISVAYSGDLGSGSHSHHSSHSSHANHSSGTTSTTGGTTGGGGDGGSSGGGGTTGSCGCGSGSGCSGGGCGGTTGGSGAGGCCSGSACFVAGTKVLLENGNEIPIETISPGDLVRGLNKNFKVIDKIVHDGKQAFSHDFSKEPLMKITFDNNKELYTVGGHPIYLNKGDGWEWSNMFGLKVGSKVGGVSGKILTVDSINYLKDETNQVLYNLELEVGIYEERSFYANGILVRDTQNIEVPIDRWICPDCVREKLKNSCSEIF